MEYRELSDKEVSVYGEIFSSLDTEGTGKVSGSKASELFFASGLPTKVLHQITELCGAKRLGHFGRSQFVVALRLIAIAQAGFPITMESLQQHGGKVALPRFDHRNDDFTPRSESTEKRRTSGSTSGLPPPPNKEHVRRTSGQNILSMLDPQITTQRSIKHRNGQKGLPHRAPSNGSDSGPLIIKSKMPTVPEPLNLGGELSDAASGEREYSEGGEGGVEVSTPTSGDTAGGLLSPSVPADWAHFSDADEDRSLLTGGKVTATPSSHLTRSLPAHHTEWTQFTDPDNDLWRHSGRHRAKGTKPAVSQSSSTPSSSESDDEDDSDEEGTENGTDVDEAVWSITDESRAYYEQQFAKLQPDPRRYVGGSTAKDFFELSKLPPTELSRIWELSDVDRDGQLNLQEFCIAMHLVVLRRNNVPIPDKLPSCLAPYSMLDNADDPFAPDLIADVPAASSGTFWSHPSQPTSSSSSTHNFQAPAAPATSLEPGSTRRAAPLPPKLESSSSDISTPSEKLINFDLKPLDPNMPHPVPKKPLAVAASASEAAPRPRPRQPQPTASLPTREDNSSAEDVSAPPPPPPRARGASQPPPPAMANLSSTTGQGQSQQSGDEDLERRGQVRMGSQPPISSRFPGDASDAFFPPSPAPAAVPSGRDRKDLMMAIRGVKEKNHSLVRLNNELNYELKEIQEQRIGLEIQLEHLRPFHG